MIVSTNPLTFRFEIFFKDVIPCKEKDAILKNKNIWKIIFESLFDYAIASIFMTHFVLWLCENGNTTEKLKF